MKRKKYLAHTPSAATLCGTAEMFRVRPWEHGADGRYGYIEFREKDHVDISGVPCGRMIACATTVVDRALLDELGIYCFPGGINIEFIEQTDGNWLVCFTARNILSAAYMLLPANEMQLVLDQSGVLK